MNAFPGVFNPEYFRGLSTCMTLEELRQEKSANDIQTQETPARTMLEDSLLIEKAVEKATAYSDKTIASLEREVADKERIISLMQQRIKDLERENYELKQYDQFREFPFEMGTAESGVYRNKDERPRV